MPLILAALATAQTGYTPTEMPLPFRADLAEAAAAPDRWGSLCTDLGLSLQETRIGDGWLHQECRPLSHTTELLATEYADLEGDDGWRVVQLTGAADEPLQQVVLARAVGGYHPIDVVEAFLEKYGGEPLACSSFAGAGWTCRDDARAIKEAEGSIVVEARLRVLQDGHFYDVSLRARREAAWGYRTAALMRYRDVTAAAEAQERAWTPPTDATMNAISDQL